MAVKVGLVGMGFMGRTHFDIHTANRKAKIVAICDADPKKLTPEGLGAEGNIGGGSGKRNFTGIQTYRNIDKMLANADLDVVDITLPTFLHTENVVKAFKAGKHVFCEKPLAINSKEAVKMTVAARKAKKMLLVGHCIRFWPSYVKAREIVQSGKYGKVVTANFIRRSLTPTWSWKNWLLNAEKSGSAAMDLHIHDSDFVLYLLGKPKAVTSHGAGLKKGRIDHIVTSYDYGPNMLVTTDGAWEYTPGFGFEMSFVVHMQKATMQLAADGVLSIHPLKGKSIKVKVPAGDGWTHELRHYIDCVVANKKSNVVTPESALQSVKLVEAEIKSVMTRKTVPVRL